MAEDIKMEEVKEPANVNAEAIAKEPANANADQERELAVKGIVEMYVGETRQHIEVTKAYYKTLFFELKKIMSEKGDKSIPNFEKSAMEYYENVVEHHDEDKLKDPEVTKFLALRHFNHKTNGEYRLTDYEEERGEELIREHRRSCPHHVECGMFHLARCTEFGEDKHRFQFNYFALMEMAADWCSVAEELGVDVVRWFRTQLKKGVYVLPDEVIQTVETFANILKPFLEENRKLGRFGLHQPDHCIK